MKKLSEEDKVELIKSITYKMNNLDKQYIALLQDILDNGVKKGDRTGTGTISVFGRTIRHKMSEGFPLLTSKHIKFDLIVSELLWFLQGRTDLRYLLEHNNHIWVGDSYKKYERAYEKGEHLIDTGLLWMGKETKETFIHRIKTDDEFAKNWGDLVPIYGKQWRNWKSPYLEEQWGYGEIKGSPFGGKQYSKFNTNVYIDQIANLIKDLKNNPDSRRLMVTAWNPSDLPNQILPPCHYGFQCYTRELSLPERQSYWLNLPDTISIISKDEYVKKRILDSPMCNEILNDLYIPKRALSLSWNQRSVDTPLGLPFNIASYGLLLEILAKICNMVPDELIGNLGDTHIYSNQVEGCIEQIGRYMTLEERKKIWESSGMGWKEEVSDLLQVQEYNSRAIPKRTREPFQLPTLKHMKSFNFWKTFDVTLFGHLDPKDFVLENYQSHPSIKFPLSN